jgi:YhhN-like protein
MVPSVERPEQRWWLLGLLVLWAGFLLGGLLLGKPNPARTARMATWTRMASSLMLVIAAWSWAWMARTGPADRFAVLIAVGMTLGFVGDLCLAGLLPLREPVLGGIGAFGLGHVAYALGLFDVANRLGVETAGLHWAAWVVWLILGLAGWGFIVLPSSQPAALRWAALPYTLLLASVPGIATTLAFQAPAFASVALGGALFFVSDLILASQLFRKLHFTGINDIIWLTYGPGQMLIVYSLGFV